MEYDAPWGGALKLMSAFVTLLLLGVIALGLRGAGEVGWVWDLAMVATPLIILIVAAFYAIRGYELTRDRLRVRRLGSSVDIDLDGLEAVAADNGAMVGSRRVFANGGLFSFSGHFRSKTLGIYRALATDPSRGVILRWPRSTLVITPDDPEGFVRAVCELRGLEVMRPE